MSYPPGPPQPDQPRSEGSGAQPAGPGDGSSPTPVPGYGQEYGGHPGYPGYQLPAPTNGKATAALIVGITTLVLSWCCGFGLLGLVAIVLGVKGRSEIRRSNGAQSGEGIALAGVITGGVAAVVGLLVVIVVIALIVGGNATFQDYAEDTSNAGARVSVLMNGPRH